MLRRQEPDGFRAELGQSSGEHLQRCGRIFNGAGTPLPGAGGVGERAHRDHRVLVQGHGEMLPWHLWRPLTWDQGSDMAAHRAFTVATDIPVRFCDLAGPWQRGSNKNTNGLLRQHFPKGTDLTVHTPEDLAAVADELNNRSRKTFDWETPSGRLSTLLATR